MSPSRAEPFPWRDVLVLSLVGLALIGAGLGLRDPWPADEPRFASLARDMVASGDWLFPHVGGDLYHDKPPLYFWLLAVAYEAFGGFRGWFLLPSLLAGLGTLVLVYDFIRRVAGREAGLLAGLTLASTLQFLLAMRGAQIDGTLCFLATFSLVALLRHLLLGPAWGWYAAGGFAAGLGVITKGVGFLPILVLLPYVAMRLGGWTGLSRIEGGGARWALAPLALLGAICVWFLPMVLAVAASGTPDLVAYRDGILFQQTITRYAQAWHHGEPWHYFFTAVIPGLWLPWSLLLFWLVPRWADAWPRRDARTWLPLAWVAIVLLFFSFSSGKRGIYVLPALPALAISAAPFLPALFARASIRRASLALAGLLVLAGIAFAGAQLLGAPWAQELLREAPAGLVGPVVAFAALGLAAWLLAALSRPLLAWPLVLACLVAVWSYGVMPRLDAGRSSRAFMAQVLAAAPRERTLGLVAYKEQFLLYLDRPTVNFGHRRWREGPQESYDAARWLAEAPAHRILLVPQSQLPVCFASPGTTRSPVGLASGETWYLVGGQPSAACVIRGDAARAIRYGGPPG